MGVSSLTVDALREALASLSRAVKRISVHAHAPDEHSSYVEPALALFRDLLERESPVTIEVQPAALAVDEVPVHTEQPREWGLCYRFHRDGVRTLTFRRGVRLDELLTLCRVAIFDPQSGPGPGREDAVTELWKADFTGIGFTSLGGYRMEHGELDARSVTAAVERIVARVRPVLLLAAAPRSAFAEETSIGETGPLVDKQRLAELDPDRWAALALRSARTLVRLVEQGFAGRDLEALEESLWRLLDELVGRRESSTLARTLEALRKMGGPHAADFREAIGKRLAEPQRLQWMAELAGLSDRALALALPHWLALLPREAGMALLEVLSKAPAAAQAQLARAAIDRADSSLERLAASLTHGTPGAALALLGALDGLAPPTRAELAAPALQHPSPRVRIEAAAAIGGEPELAVQLLGRLLRAPEGSVRTAAAWVLAGCGGVAEAAGQLLVDTIDTDEFDGREREERFTFHRALGRLGSNTGFTFLSERLNESRGLFRKKPAEEERLMAVAGIAEENAMRSVRALEAAAAPESGQPAAVSSFARAALARAHKPAGRAGRSA